MSKDIRFEVEHPAAQGGTIANVITDKETGVQYLLAIFLVRGLQSWLMRRGNL
ncbi:DUF6440 family protein [Bacillus horti]|uniref:DUF6440 domain-containing protein n=2 Tax=Caldalkalibacillus horti TaxID=77523 RepID=A0ABT9W4Y3_9BACI|nr:DUF6440 family protein [Bacillus horti]MDQ0168307.1 hypothetical protein [Bacillus horti]